MDIEYLLALQQLRAQLGGIVENVMLGASLIGDGPALVALSLVIYWCIDKRMGQFAIGSMSVGNFVSQLLKNICCIYRPWIRDARIVPATGALEGAGGYSFPSGHATGITATMGSIAWSVRKRHKAIAVICVLFMLLVIFSRNYLGVHTPQDVVAGFAAALVTIALINVFLNWMERCDAMTPWHSKDVGVTVIVLIVCAASVAFVFLKPYPMNYVAGALLVNPEDMQKGSFEGAGMLAGVTLGWLLERRFVRFQTGPDVGAAERVVRGILGVGIVGVVYVVTDKCFKAILPYIWAKLCAYFVLTLVAVFLVPLLFKLVERIFRPKQEKRGAHASK